MPMPEAAYDLFKSEQRSPADLPTTLLLPPPPQLNRRFRAEVRLPVRFLVFSGLEYSPGGGWRDFKAGFICEIAAMAVAEEIASEHWCQVVDLQCMRIVYQRHVPWGSPTYNHHGPQCR